VRSLLRRWPLVVIGILVLGAVGGGGVLYVRHVRHVEAMLAAGKPCSAGSECHGGVCIRDDQDNQPLAVGYCGNLCEADDDCPNGFICQPTRSGKRHACMIGERDR
jgi:hypothetical protein